MAWYLGIMGFLFILLFVGLCMVDVINKKKKENPEFNTKVDKFFDKTDPFFNFIENLWGWVMVALFIWFIALR